MLKKGDILILLILGIALISSIALNSFFKDKGNRTLIIEVDGLQYASLALDTIKEQKIYHIDRPNERYIDIVVDSEGAYVSDVICPDKLCKKTGKIQRPGQSIVCLPNRVVIYIEGDAKKDIDDMTY